jgi:integrase
MAVRLAKATGKAYTISDSKGLWLAVAEQGGKSWHFRYYWNGKQKRMSLGKYPAVSLKQARTLRDEAHQLIVKGIHPGQFRRQNRKQAQFEETNTFNAIYEKWYAHRCLSLKEGRQTTRRTIKRVFAKDVLPFIGKRPISEIRRADLLGLLARVEQRRALSVAERIRGWLNQLFRFALVTLPSLGHNPATDLDVVAAPQPPVRHNPHLRMDELPRLLQRLRSYRGSFQTQLGLKLLLLTGVRTGELRQATPRQFDVLRGLWVIPPEAVKQIQCRMRKKRLDSSDIPPYVVPLPIQALEIVQFMLDQVEPGQIYLFHHRTDLTVRISENTLNSCLRRIGFQDQLTGHGIRGTISTALNEIGYPKDWVDAQLSHADPNRVSAAYNHAEYIEQRRAMMQDWADRLDMLEQGMAEHARAPLGFGRHGHAAPTSGAKAAPMERPRKEPRQTASFTEPEQPIQLCKPNQTDPSAVSHDTPRLPALLAPKHPLPEEQRRRLEQLDTFDLPHNLPAAIFAKMAGKSIRTLNYQISTGHYLALSFGSRGKRIPDWHLDPHKHALIESVLKLMGTADPWQVYHVLSCPNPRLGNIPPLDLAKSGDLPTVVMAVCQALKEQMASCQAAAPCLA